MMIAKKNLLSLNTFLFEKKTEWNNRCEESLQNRVGIRRFGACHSLFWNSEKPHFNDASSVSLIDEREAMRFLHEPETVFADARNCSDVAKSKVKGAVCLPANDIQRRFPLAEPLVQPENIVILYCYGPECDMAERIARSLAGMG